MPLELAQQLVVPLAQQLLVNPGNYKEPAEAGFFVAKY